MHLFRPPETTEASVSLALQNGFRQIDSAAFYNNEAGCGRAILNSDIPRSDIFFTTKLAPVSMGYEATKQAISKSLADSGLSYIDLYLIHAPFGDTNARNGSWRAMVEAVDNGQIRSLGVSNYGIHHFEELEKYRCGPADLGHVPISVAQIELHPWMQRKDTVKFCDQRHVVMQAFGPLCLGKQSDNADLVLIARSHNKTWAQVLLRWSLQKGFSPLPKSTTKARIKENTDIFDFALTEFDMRKLDTDSYLVNRSHWDPSTWGLSGPGSKQ